MRREKIGLGLIGLGNIGKIHLRNCLKLEFAELVAVCDRSKKALKYAKKIGIKNTYRDYQRLLKNQNVNAVIIGLPTFLHRGCSQDAAEAGKDILLEKPLATNVSDGKEIIKTAKRNGVKIMVGYPLRFAPSFLDLKKKIESGILGEVQSVYAVFVGPGPFFHRSERDVPRPVPSWWFDKKLSGGGAIIDLGCHLINLLRWYFGEVSHIKSYLGHRFSLDIEDYATCLAKFNSGPLSIINVGWFSQEEQLKVELLGTLKHASASRKPQSLVAKYIQQLIMGWSKPQLSYLRELEYFVQCVKHDIPPKPSGDDALKDLETISLAYKNKINM